MSDWDMVTVGLILVGCSMIAAGLSIAAMILGLFRSSSQFLLLTSTVLIVVGAAVILYVDHRNGQRNGP